MQSYLTQSCSMVNMRANVVMYWQNGRLALSYPYQQN